ncbi:MAG TPA: BlaI/MecI/CopY family transcriptional regulator [Armatimonadota bacterium]|nr:BlaI/MecI/CopY family transcriptional regulator [Armatimonadota bacterium]
MESNANIKDYIGVRRSLDGQSLGELEAQILDIMWDLEPPITSTQVFKIMYPRRELSYSTIMLTMAKLSRKGILTQRRTGDKKTDPFVYVPNVSRTEMGLRLMQEVSKKVLGKPLQEAVRAILADSSDLTEGDLKRIEAAIGKALG